MIVEYLVHVAGFQYVFGTGGVSASAAPVDPDDGWGSADIIVDTLVRPTGAIEASLSPSDGVLTVSGMSFVLHDLPLDDGRLLCTFYGTRHSSSVVSVKLATAIDGSSTDFDVSDATGIIADDVVWIGQEAIVVDAPTGNTVPILDRGTYGSLEADHSVDALVFREYPGHERRRVVLYEVRGTVATPIWRGYTEEGIDESDGNEASYILSARGAWNKISEQRLGITPAVCRVRGFDMAAVKVRVRWDALFPERLVDTYWTGTQQLDVVTTAEELSDQLQSELVRQFAARGVSTGANIVKASVTATGGELRVTVQFFGTSRDGASIALDVAGDRGEWVTVVDGPNSSKVAIAEAALPGACRVFFVDNDAGAAHSTIQVDNVTGLPSAWTSVVTTQDTVVTSVRPVLRAPWGEDAFIVVEPGDTTADPPSLDDCKITFKPKRRGDRLSSDALGFRTFFWSDGRGGSRLVGAYVITEPLSLTFAYRVTSGHWIYALRYAIFRDPTYTSQTPSDAPDYLRGGLDPRDWDWSSTLDVRRLSDGIPTDVEWYLDSAVQVGALVRDYVRFAGCAIMVRDSKLVVWPIQPPVPSDTIAATINHRTGDTVAGARATRKPLRGALINAVLLTMVDGTLRVVDGDSQERYGQASALELQLDGTDNAAQLSGSTASLAETVLSRVIGLFSDTVHVVTLTLPLVYADDVKQGDFVRVSASWSLPDGAGNRGYTLTAAQLASTTRGIGQVITHKQGLEDGTLVLELLTFGLTGFAGYSPCGKVESVTGHQELVLDRSFFDAALSTKNYNGSDATTGDAGAADFAIGQKIALRLMDSTADTREGGYVVDSFPDVRTIRLTNVLTGTPDWETLLAGGAWIIVEFDSYATSGLTDAQKGYAWIGDITLEVIDGTDDPATRWAP